MKRKLWGLVILALIACPARGEVDRSRYTAAEWEQVVSEAAANRVAPTLIGGTVAPAGMFPASPWVGNCSATLIGDRVLDTAAHCVSNGGTKTFEIGSTRYTAKCAHHPSYRGNSTADWALCLVDKVVAGVPFERVPKDAAQVDCKVGAKYTLTGYGCQRWGGGIDGKFRYGTAEVTSCPSGTNYDIVTRATVALCSGDSGGGGYRIDGEDRWAIMVNSRSNTTTTSYMPSRGTSAFRDWALGWAAGNGVKICGLHADAANCRLADDTPPPPPPPPGDCRDEVAAAVDAQTRAGAALAAVKSCVEAGE